jgi:ubiquinone/menaquinone biosynthesis C-methylase UbiE
MSPFRDYVCEYEDWFVKYPHVYAAELRALRSLLPLGAERTLDVGVGTGRFAHDLGVGIGVDPSSEMLALAGERGIKAILARAESLPFADRGFDLVVMITVLCFLADPFKALLEIRRVLDRGGHIVLAFIDRHSPLGKLYCQQQADSLFYREAHFYGVDEVADLLEKAGFGDLNFCQTIFYDPDNSDLSPFKQVSADEPVLSGSGKGGFVVVKAKGKFILP